MSLFDGAVQALMALKTSVTADGEAEAATPEELTTSVVLDGEAAATAPEEPHAEPATIPTTAADVTTTDMSPAMS